MEKVLCDFCFSEVSKGGIWPGSPPQATVYQYYPSLMRRRELILCPRCDMRLKRVICRENKKQDWKNAIRTALKMKPVSADGFEEDT